jgi:hypothetical protein
VGIHPVVKTAMVAHAEKNPGGGLPELSAELERRGHLKEPR